MATTPNIGLTTYTSAAGSAVSFSTYRLSMADTLSNMSIIDSYLGGVGGSIVSLNISSVRNVDATWISTNYFTCTAPSITSYLTGQIINVQFNLEIAGDTTIDINSVGSTVLKKLDLQGTKVALVSGDLLSDLYYYFIYDGTNFVLMNQLAEHITISGSSSNFVSIGASNVLQDSGVPILIDRTTGSYNAVQIDEYGRVVSGSVMDYSGGGGATSIAGSEVMSNSNGSVVVHNDSGILSGSYTQVEVDIYGHVISGSITAAGGTSSIAGSEVMSDTTGSVVIHNVSGVSSGSYNALEVDIYGHVVSGSVTASTTVITGSEVMSSTHDSVVVHNESGIASGSYTSVGIDTFGHVTSASLVEGMTLYTSFYSASEMGGAANTYNDIGFSNGMLVYWSNEEP